MTAYDKTIFSLSGKTALVTGAGGYLGRSIASALAEAGAKVYLNGRRETPLLELRETLVGRGFSAEVASGGVEQPETIEAIRSALGCNECLDILVNNAYAGGPGNLETAAGSDYLTAFSITVIATANIVQSLLGLLRASPNASIINIASMYGIVSPNPKLYKSGAENPPFYGAAKGGLLQWTRYAAVHLAPDGIRVNAISPGPFPAPDIQKSQPEFVSALAAKTPMKRIGLAEELRGPVLFLASEASSYVTGANLVVDGGWTIW